MQGTHTYIAQRAHLPSVCHCSIVAGFRNFSELSVQVLLFCSINSLFCCILLDLYAWLFYSYYPRASVLAFHCASPCRLSGVSFVWLCLDWWCEPLFLLFIWLDWTRALPAACGHPVLSVSGQNCDAYLTRNSQFWASSLFSLCSHALHPTGYERLSHSFIHGTSPEGLNEMDWFTDILLIKGQKWNA